MLSFATYPKQHTRTSRPVPSCSTEAEIRHILGNAAAQDHKPRLGSLLPSIRDEIVGVDLDPARDRSPDNPIDLS